MFVISTLLAALMVFLVLALSHLQSSAELLLLAVAQLLALTSTRQQAEAQHRHCMVSLCLLPYCGRTSQLCKRKQNGFCSCLLLTLKQGQSAIIASHAVPLPH